MSVHSLSPSHAVFIEASQHSVKQLDSRTGFVVNVLFFFLQFFLTNGTNKMKLFMQVKKAKPKIFFLTKRKFPPSFG